MASSNVMLVILHALGIFVCDLLKSRRRLQAEKLFLRHQLNIALRRAPVCTAIPRIRKTTITGIAHNTLIDRPPNRMRGITPSCGGSQSL